MLQQLSVVVPCLQIHCNMTAQLTHYLIVNVFPHLSCNIIQHTISNLIINVYHVLPGIVAKRFDLWSAHNLQASPGANSPDQVGDTCAHLHVFGIHTTVYCKPDSVPDHQSAWWISMI
jgi:hypothetical protein